MRSRPPRTWRPTPGSRLVSAGVRLAAPLRAETVGKGQVETPAAMLSEVEAGGKCLRDFTWTCVGFRLPFGSRARELGGS